MFPGSFETYINSQELRNYPKSLEEDEQTLTQEEETELYGSWLSSLTSFHKLILVKCCKEEKVRCCCFLTKDCVITISTKAQQLVMIHELIRLTC